MTDFLGFDFSTQQIKAVIVDGCLKVNHTYGVQFETDLPQYNTTGGVHINGTTVTSPVLMWVEAFDQLLQSMRSDGVDFASIAAVSGAGQQHGSVYWSDGAGDLLRHLDANKSLKNNLQSAFTAANSPVWMDASTGQECRQLEEAVGGPLELARITGSRAFHRFTGPQIAKIHKNQPDVYERTEISLVSSFACSLLLGDYAAIDWADGSGMNLFDINKHQLSTVCLDACAPLLADKLGSFVPSNQQLGRISSYFVDRYGFNPTCAVIAFTGDNCATLAGLNMRTRDIAVSWGTSDTVFLWSERPSATLSVFVSCNAVDKDVYMSLLCFKNGAFTRERVRRECDCNDWEQFNKLLDASPPGNNGCIGMFYDNAEILPDVPAGDHRFNSDNQRQSERFPNAVEARAVIEHQCLAKRVYAEQLNSTGDGRLLVTGGASVNLSLMQVLADVFQRNVYVQDIANAAALGSAYRAKHGISRGESFATVCSVAESFVLACQPREQYKKVYDDLAKRYSQLEAIVAQRS